MSDIPPYGKAMTMGIIPGNDHQAVLSLREDYWKRLMQVYLASVAFVDDQIGKILDSPEANGLSGDTNIVLTSDHRQNFGEKVNWRKMCLWEKSTRVPLIVRVSGQSEGASCSAAVSLLDTYRTLAGLCDLSVESGIDGMDLSPLIEDPNMNWDHPVLTVWRYGNFAVRSNHWRYIQYRDGTEELYDHRYDPLERLNVIGHDVHREKIERFRTLIPTEYAIPFGQTEWTGDELDELVTEWGRNGEPAWMTNPDPVEDRELI